MFFLFNFPNLKKKNPFSLQIALLEFELLIYIFIFIFGGGSFAFVWTRYAFLCSELIAGT